MTWRIFFQRICSRIPICTVRGLFLIKMIRQKYETFTFALLTRPFPSTKLHIFLRFDFPLCYLQMWVWQLRLPSSTFLRPCIGPFEVGPTHDLAAIEVILRLTFFCPRGLEDQFVHAKLSRRRRYKNPISHRNCSLNFRGEIWQLFITSGDENELSHEYWLIRLMSLT